MESDPVTITDIRWDSDRNRNSGSREQDIDGYGVRVLNEAGEVVGEMYKPSNVQGGIKWRDLNAAGDETKKPKRDAVPKMFRQPKQPPNDAPGI